MNKLIGCFERVEGRLCVESDGSEKLEADIPASCTDSLFSKPPQSGMACGFNRSMQQVGQIVQRVFHSLAFFLDADLISSPRHLAWLASKQRGLSP
jgi:hypothetical protein